METIFAPTLAEAFQRAGMQLNGSDPQPGRVLRFPTNDRDHDRAGWLSMFPDGDGAVFGCWRAGESFSWQRRDLNAPAPSAAEREASRAKADAARQVAEAERQAQHSQAAELARRVWSESKPATAHPYLMHKGIRAHGARLHKDGRLVLPVKGADGDIQSLQFIPDDGKSKRFLTNASMKGGRLALGTPDDNAPIILAEGFATAASIREATGHDAVVIGFFGSNLETVAVDLRRQYPTAPLIVAGDLDASGIGAKYAQAATRACRAAKAVYPAFADGRASGDWNDLHQAEGLETVKRQITAVLAPSPRYLLLTGNDIAARPPLRWCVRGVLPESGLAAMFGASGCGKTFLILDMAHAIAEGREWFGHRVYARQVVYCALEGEAGIAGRVQAYRIGNGVTGDGVRYLAQPFNLLDGADVGDLVHAILAIGGEGCVLILDTLNRAAPGTDENDSKDMGRIIEAAKRLQRDLAGLVLLVHHTGKDASKGLRGHSSLLAALDAAIEVSRDHDRREWKLHKAKDGEDGIAHPFCLDLVEIGADEDGEPLTSCIVRPDQGANTRRPMPPKTGNQRIVWDALGEPLRDSTTYGMAGAPASRPCITLEAAIEQSRGKLVCEPKRQTERTRAAILGLVSRGLLQHQDGWLWCA